MEPHKVLSGLLKLFGPVFVLAGALWVLHAAGMQVSFCGMWLKDVQTEDSLLPGALDLHELTALTSDPRRSVSCRVNSRPRRDGSDQWKYCCRKVELKSLPDSLCASDSIGSTVNAEVSPI